MEASKKQKNYLKEIFPEEQSLEQAITVSSLSVGLQLLIFQALFFKIFDFIDVKL